MLLKRLKRDIFSSSCKPHLQLGLKEGRDGKEVAGSSQNSPGCGSKSRVSCVAKKLLLILSKPSLFPVQPFAPSWSNSLCIHPGSAQQAPLYPKESVPTPGYPPQPQGLSLQHSCIIGSLISAQAAQRVLQSFYRGTKNHLPSSNSTAYPSHPSRLTGADTVHMIKGPYLSNCNSRPRDA